MQAVRRPHLIIASAVVLLSTATSAAVAGSETGALHGTITDTITNKPVPKATVYLYDESRENLIASDVTNDKGRYWLADLTEGSYWLVTKKPDYVRYFTDVAAPRKSSFDLRMSPKSGRMPAGVLDVEVGAPGHGFWSAVRNDDGVYLPAHSASSGTGHKVKVNAFFGDIPRASDVLSLIYEGKNTSRCRQSLRAWNEEEGWVLLDRRRVGPDEQRVRAALPRDPAHYIPEYPRGPGTGVVKVQFTCRRGSKFTTKMDLVRLKYAVT